MLYLCRSLDKACAGSTARYLRRCRLFGQSGKLSVDRSKEGVRHGCKEETSAINLAAGSTGFSPSILNMVACDCRWHCCARGDLGRAPAQSDNILFSQRAPAPRLPVRLHLLPGSADNILADRPPEQRAECTPNPARVGARQIGARDHRLYLLRHPHIAWQRLAVPFPAHPVRVVQSCAWHADRHRAK
jgi:hypothetical protein